MTNPHCSYHMHQTVPSTSPNISCGDAYPRCSHHTLGQDCIIPHIFLKLSDAMYCLPYFLVSSPYGEWGNFLWKYNHTMKISVLTVKSGVMWSPVGIWSNLWRKIPEFYWFRCFFMGTHFLLLLMSDTMDSSGRLLRTITFILFIIEIVIIVITLEIVTIVITFEIVIMCTKFRCEIYYSD